MLDEIEMPKTFSAWIIPGVIVPPFRLSKEPMKAIAEIHTVLCDMHDLDKYQLFIKPTATKKGKRSIGSTAELSYIRQMLLYFMKDIYKSRVTHKELSKYLGLRTPTGALKAIEVFAGYIETDQLIPKKLGNITVRQDYYKFNEIVRPWL